MAYSECLPTRLNPLAERACFPQAREPALRPRGARRMEDGRAARALGGRRLDLGGRARAADRPCGPRPPGAVTRPSRSLAFLSVSHSKSVLCGGFVWARRALNRQNWRLSAPRAAACLVHSLLLQKVTSPRFTILSGCRPRAGRRRTRAGSSSSATRSRAPRARCHNPYPLQ